MAADSRARWSRVSIGFRCYKISSLARATRLLGAGQIADNKKGHFFK
jgi:hypothetical protein